MTSLALARKWRPQNFDTVVGQEHVVQGLTHALETNRLHHAYLFTGTRGVGKTTLARIFAKCMNCETGITAKPCGKCPACTGIDDGSFLDLIEIDAASRTRVEDTRDLLDNVQYAPTSGRFKVYLIDEVHMLSTHSFNALLKTLEEPPEHVKFLLATTDPQKLPVTVLSRCLQYHLRPLSSTQIQTHLSTISQAEEVVFEEDALRLIATAADGSVRDSLSLLDQAIAYTENDLTTDSVRQMIGAVDEALLYGLIDAVSEGDAKSGLELTEQLFGHTVNFELLLDKMARFWQQVAIAQIVPPAHSEFNLDKVNHLANTLSAGEVQVHYQVCIKSKADLNLAPDAFTGFQMTVLRMLALKPLGEVQAPVIQSKPAPIPRRPAVEAPKASAPVKPAPKPVAAPQSLAEPQQAKAPQAQNVSVPTAENWGQFVAQLDVSGITRQLANHTLLVGISGQKWTLGVEKAFESLLSEQIVRKLSVAISQQVGTTVSLVIQSDAKAASETPAAQAKEVRKQIVKSAQDSILEDENLKTLKDAFNAEIDGKTIKPIEE